MNLKNNEEKEDKEIDEITKEIDELKQSEALNKVLLKLLKNNNKENIRLWLVTLFLIIFSLFMIVFLQLSNMAQQDKFIAEQDKYLKFLKGLDYDIQIVEEDKEGIKINQDNNNGNNVVQTGSNSIYNQ